MNFYKPDELFIATVGTAYIKHIPNIRHITNKNYVAIVKPKNSYYLDVISKSKYIFIGDYNCLNGNLAIDKPLPLALNFYKYFYKDQKVNDDILDHIYKKITTNKMISKEELRILYLILNNSYKYIYNDNNKLDIQTINKPKIKTIELKKKNQGSI